MSATALIKEADLLRMAKVVRKSGVRVEVVVDGKLIRVSPDIPDNHKPEEGSLPDDFTLI